KGRPRYRFTNDALQILKQFFEQNPYPDLAAKQELANQIHCDAYVIDKWFRNRRTRLPPGEKQRV
ncbi:Double homeobox protein A, partial [Heterocephalus glaber]